MERSEGVTTTLVSIMKWTGRSDDNLVRSMSPFEGSYARIGARALAPQPVTGIRVVPNASLASVAAVDWPSSDRLQAEFRRGPPARARNDRRKGKIAVRTMEIA